VSKEVKEALKAKEKAERQLAKDTLKVCLTIAGVDDRPPKRPSGPTRRN
jgi:hypothetical protein